MSAATLPASVPATDNGPIQSAPLPAASKGKGKAANPVTVAYNTLRKLGLILAPNSDTLRATESVAVAAMARRQCGKLASAEVAGKSLQALNAIGVIEKNANDCLPTDIGGPNPDHVRIGEVFGTLLGFNADARKARNVQIAKYVANLK